LGSNIHIVNNTIFTAKDGRKFYVTHGDEFDIIMQSAHWLMTIGDWIYTILLQINRAIGYVRRRFNMDYWSFSAWAKSKTKEAIAFIKDFERAMGSEAKRHGCQGVISGHIHHPQIKTLNDLTYCNCGDWVENCSALVETDEGVLELVFST
jgi:UDP-2,3-diacylglucosamine pyrophosphatase LpxH